MSQVRESAAPLALSVERTAPRLKPWWKPALVVAPLFLLVAVGAAYFWQKAPPLAARLLPESDGIVYFNVGPIRTATGFDPRPVKHDADYQRFVDATGIQFERDLDQASFALHSMSNPLGPNGPTAFSSIFVGKFDRTRLSTYLASIAQSKEQYAGHDIYSIPVEGRTDRVAILAGDAVAVSNTPTAEQIHSILDRNRTALWLPFTGNTLLSQRYREVPAFSLAWGLGKLAAGLGDGLNVFGFRIPLSVDASFVASLRWAGALHLKIEEIAPNGAAASLSANSLQALVTVFKTAENALPNAVTDAETKDLLNSVEIEHHNDRAVVTATIPLGLLRKLTATSGAPNPSP